MDLLWLGHRYAGFWRVIGGSRRLSQMDDIESRAWIRWFLDGSWRLSRKWTYYG